MATSTPWGPSQTSHQIAPGIMSYSTAGHGGIHLSAKRWQELKQIFPDFQPWAGPGWLEEDCDYSYAMLVWPECWPDDYSMFCLTRYGMKWLKAVTDEYKQSPTWKTINERADRWFAANQENWMRGGMSGGHGTPRGYWEVRFNRVKDKEAREVIMPYPEKSIYTTEELDTIEAQTAELTHASVTDF